jgi:hypothetical protein
MAIAAPSVHVKREQFHLAWDPAIPPIATVASGSVVELDMLDASGGQLTARSSVADLAKLDLDRVDQVNGPIEVEGAEPGDSLQVELLEFRPAEWGWTASIPGFGLLADDFPEPIFRATRLPEPPGPAEFLPGVRVPLLPFCGEVGVAPETGPRSTIPPGNDHRGHVRQARGRREGGRLGRSASRGDERRRAQPKLQSIVTLRRASSSRSRSSGSSRDAKCLATPRAWTGTASLRRARPVSVSSTRMPRRSSGA